jgi:hypothetical protein
MASNFKINYCGVEFEIAGDGEPPKFLFGVRKSGSSIMNSMLAEVGRFNGVNYVDVAGRMFEKGKSVAAWQNDSGLATLIRPGNLYGGFRNAPLGLKASPSVVSGRKVLLVRDPRDALVSEYYSNAFSHSIPVSGSTRDEMLAKRANALQSSIHDYVTDLAPRLKVTLQQYYDFLDMPDMRVYRYEQAIMDKRWFLQDVCRHFGWTAKDELIENIMKWADVMPTEEVPTEFVRKVKPGDHLDKLDVATIAMLDDIFKDELKRYGYAP